jgi:prephenate dehydrogenase
MVCENVAIIGVGLIGGSIALALRQRGLARRIVGIVRRRESVDDLLQRGVVTDATTDLSSGVSAAEFIVVCTPVDSISRYVLEAARWCPEHAVITDAGSTKGRIVAEVESGWVELHSRTQAAAASDSPPCRFVGSHPLAGSEKSGYQYADPQLLAGRWVVVTPTARSDAQATERTVAFWQALGARVCLMAPEDHDRALALTSHLPHLVASALAGILPLKWADLAASGFRDTTRIAAGPPEIWTPIFLHNRSALLEALGQFEQQLHRFRQALETENAEMLSALLTQGKSRRDSLA